MKLVCFETNAKEEMEESLLQKETGFKFDLEESPDSKCVCCKRLKKWAFKWLKFLQDFAVNVWEFVWSDLRKIIFAAKMGLSLTLISLVIFLKEPFGDVGRYSVWAILTVVVVFEYTVGATLSKGFNRGLGTFLAGALALGMAELSELAGEFEELLIVTSIFITGFCATFTKMYPAMKPYEYGFRVFLLTYCFIMVSGYRTREFIETAVTRFVLIAIGACVCLVVNICIYPIWAGEELHNLIVKNFMGVADSLEGCVDRYLKCTVECESISSKILSYQVSDDPLYSGYRIAVESLNLEESLVGFAIWEPPHGHFKMLRYPWKNYVKVGSALRHCAFMVMALHGCILSEIQAPPEKRQVFSAELKRVGNAGANVLRELGNKVKIMEKLGPGDILFEVHAAADELQRKIDNRSYLLVNSKTWEIGKQDMMIKDGITVPRSFELSKSWDVKYSGIGCNSCLPLSETSQRKKLWKQTSLPLSSECLLSFGEAATVAKPQMNESASALSLATFASLLIEFVARLRNIVDSFEDLSDKANFKEAYTEAATEAVGFWTRLSRQFRF